MLTKIVNSSNDVLYEFNSETHKGIFNGTPPLCTSFTQGKLYAFKGDKKPTVITYNPDAENHDEFHGLFVRYIREQYKGGELKVKLFTDHSQATLT